MRSIGFDKAKTILIILAKRLDITESHLMPGSHREGGFTLVETLVALLITSIIIFVSYTVLGQMLWIHTAQRGALAMQQSARTALDLMTREILSAGFDPLGIVFDGKVDGRPPEPPDEPPSGIPSGDAVSIRIIADLNGDGSIEPVGSRGNEDITYSWVDADNDGVGEIMRQVDLNSDGDFNDISESIVLAEYILMAADCDMDSIPEGIFCFDTSPPGAQNITISFTSRSANWNQRTRKFLFFTLNSELSPRNLNMP